MKENYKKNKALYSFITSKGKDRGCTMYIRSQAIKSKVSTNRESKRADPLVDE